MRHRGPQRAAVRALCVALLLLFTGAASAAELWSSEDGEQLLSLDTTLKAGTFLSRNPDDRALYPSRTTALGLSRVRLDLNMRFDRSANALVAYEVSGRWASRDNAFGGLGVLPSVGDPAWRITPLFDDLHEGNRTVAFHELDRALIALHPRWGEVTIGRQAIGLGRGVLFSAVDVFAPFSPLEVDREWRRGVDAARVEARLSPTTSVEGVGVFGSSMDNSAFFLRGRGYVGPLDAELLGGWHAEDEFVAAVVSSALYDAEVHGELALFHTPDDHPDGGLFGARDLILKALIGSSYTFNVGNGLTLLGEYHYSGFGAKDTGDISMLFARPDFQKRLLRGDTQILGRHALGAQLSYPFNESLSGSVNVLFSPTDGSGTLSPGIRWDISRTTSLDVVAFLPWGEGPGGGMLRSQYGGSPYSLFAQLSVYF